MNITPETNLLSLIDACPECLEFIWPFRRQLHETTTVSALASYIACDSVPLVLGLERCVERARWNPCEWAALRHRLIRPGFINVAGFVDFMWQDGLEQQLHTFAAEQGFFLNLVLFPKHEKKQFQNYLARCERIEDLPDLLIGKGFSSLMTQQFIDRFVSSGAFTHPLDVPYSAVFEAAGLRDPRQEYHPFGIDEYVMVFDPVADPDCEIPQHWDDLQHPRYRGKITQMGKPQRDHFGFAQLFFLMQAGGEAGIARYARNVKRKQHFSWIIKNLASPGAPATPINVMHQYATRFIRRNVRDWVSVLSPPEGNPVTARFLLLKQNALPAAVALARHFYEPPVQELLTDAGLTPAATASRPIRWVGWDEVKHAQLPFLKEYLSHIVYQQPTLEIL
jgi:hypothetical protein